MAKIRKFQIPELSGSEASNCCGVDEFYGWSTRTGKIPLTDEEWFNMLDESLRRGYSEDILNAIIILTANHKQKGIFSQGAFAKWLKNRGENVVETPWVKNINSGNKVKLWAWTPSSKFRKELEKYTYKMDKEQEEKQKSGRITADYDSYY